VPQFNRNWRGNRNDGPGITEHMAARRTYLGGLAAQPVDATLLEGYAQEFGILSQKEGIKRRATLKISGRITAVG
jgi:hypothetical protein